MIQGLANSLSFDGKVKIPYTKGIYELVESDDWDK